MLLSLVRYTCVFGLGVVLVLVVSSWSSAYDFEMSESPLSELAAWVGSVTQKNIIVPKDLDRPCTFQIRGLGEDQVFPLFRAVVRSTGATLVEDSGFWIVQGGGVLDRSGSPAEDLPDSLDPLPALAPCDVWALPLEHVDSRNVATSVAALVNVNACVGEFVNAPLFSNSLLVATTTERIEVIRSVLEALDRPAQRLLVRAVIYEEMLGKTENVGINLNASGLDAVLRSLAPGVSLNPVSGGGVLGVLRGDFEALVNAVVTSDDVRVLSTPELLVNDRSQGRVSVGQNVPFVTGQYKTDDDGNVSTFQTIERRDVGVSLDVLPFVLSEGRVKLKLAQDASSVSTSSAASDIITNTRNLQTEVTVAPGEVIYLGGLFSQDQSKAKTRVPLLSKIPLIGRLFRSHSDQQQDRRLSVILSVQSV